MDLPPLDSGAPLSLSPTDVSQFIRLEQCERYLRLRLVERFQGRDFLRGRDVTPQPIPPILTRSGRAFEEAVEAEVAARHRTLNWGPDGTRPGRRPPDTARFLQEARELAPGETLVVFQARIQARVGSWLLTGDPDLLRLERSTDGSLDLFIGDMKSTTRVKVEHRLQVAFYHAMLGALFQEAGIPLARIRTGILYRGAAEEGPAPAGDSDTAVERQAAREFLGAPEALLSLTDDPEAYLGSVADLVTGPGSAAERVASAPFADVPFHLTYKCDGCLYNEFCMAWAAESDDLSLIPHLSVTEKSALKRAGIDTAATLATLKAPVPGSPEALRPAPGREDECRALASTWPVGPRLDELIHRARRYRRWKGDPCDAPSYIPGAGYGSLPYSGPEQNPNLVRVYLDAQHDYLHDRLYLLGARVVADEAGVAARRRSIVRLAAGPPDDPDAEARLLGGWVQDTLRAIVELAGPDEAGEPRAPIHLVFYNAWEQRLLLDALSRHFSRLLDAAPALYDFMTQLAAFDSPVATFLDQEIRDLRNYPMVCQSLQAVARYLGFDWSSPEPFDTLFRERLFDDRRRLEREGAEPEWYTGRARFNSQVPLEYAYCAWGELLPPQPGREDPFARYRGATPELLARFQARRLEAMEHIAGQFPGNRQTQKAPFRLPDLAAFDERARTLAHALDEFVTIERHVELDAWKRARLASPERRVLMGETLLAEYREEDQLPGVADQVAENARRLAREQQLREAFRAANPDARRVTLGKDEKEACRRQWEGVRIRLRLPAEALDCDLEEALGLFTLEPGSRWVLFPRWTVDERLPPPQRTPFTPTARQLLYGPRVELLRVEEERDAGGRLGGVLVEVGMAEGGGTNARGFAFNPIERPLLPGERYTLDPCPNNWHGAHCAEITGQLCALEAAGEADRCPAYSWLRGGPGSLAGRSRPAAPATLAGQARFLEGLLSFRDAGLLHDFEASKREFIGGRGDVPVLLVQGPPGTGKSYSTAFALLARMQGAVAAGREFRALLACKTHAATDVLLHNVLAAQRKLEELREADTARFDRYFDRRLLDAPLFRYAPRETQPDGIRARGKERAAGEPDRVDELLSYPWCVGAATPGGIRRLVKERWPRDRDLFGHSFSDCVVLDEASQMSLPEAVLAALPLRPDGQLLVVGDHRQMPPIVQHDWESEPRRTFREYRAYESLFLALLALAPPVIRFAESFRLHAAMAEFLRQEVYRRDGIPYFSRRRDELSPTGATDPFVRAVLDPAYPLVVVLHEESGSQTRNGYEQALIAPVLRALSEAGLDAEEGLGVVVPHRAQRAAFRQAFPFLSVLDDEDGEPRRSAVDTVERFQGGERSAIVISATESDPEYLQISGRFLLDPRRLTVALSRAKRKLVLVASRSVFGYFSPDEETFESAQLWKNLLRRSCPTELWSGEFQQLRVEVRGGRETPPGSTSG